MNHVPNKEVQYYPTLRYYSILRGMVVTFYMPVDVFLVMKKIILLTLVLLIIIYRNN